MREWGWQDGWFSGAELLATTEDLSRHSLWRRRKPLLVATEDECESTKAEEGGGGGLWDFFRLPLPSLGGFEYLEASYPQIQGAQ